MKVVIASDVWLVQNEDPTRLSIRLKTHVPINAELRKVKREAL
jgi:hypothetical protein